MFLKSSVIPRWDQYVGEERCLSGVAAFKIPQSHSRAEAWHARQMEVDLWMTVPTLG